MESEDLPYEARIELCPVDQRERELVRSIYRSLIAEARSPANVGRIRIGIDLQGPCLCVTMKTDTESHLRAVLNSMMYLIHVAKEVVYRVESEQPS